MPAVLAVKKGLQMDLTGAVLQTHFKDYNLNENVPSVFLSVKRIIFEMGAWKERYAFLWGLCWFSKSRVDHRVYPGTLRAAPLTSWQPREHGRHFFSFLTSSYDFSFPVTRDSWMSKYWWEQVAEHWHGFRTNFHNLQSPSPFWHGCRDFLAESRAASASFSPIILIC